MSDKNNTIDNEIEDRIKALKDLNNSRWQGWEKALIWSVRKI